MSGRLILNQLEGKAGSNNTITIPAGHKLNFGNDVSISSSGISTTSGFIVSVGGNEDFIVDTAGRVIMPYQPFVFVTRSTNVSMSSGSKIPYNLVLDSRNLTWDTTNNNFVVPVTGVYTFSIYIRLEIANSGWIYAKIRSNGIDLYNPTVLYLQKPNTADGFQTTGVTISVKLTQNDTVDVIGVWNGTSPATLLALQSSMSIVFNG